MDFRSPFFYLTLWHRVILLSTTRTTVMMGMGRGGRGWSQWQQQLGGGILAHLGLFLVRSTFTLPRPSTSFLPQAR